MADKNSIRIQKILIENFRLLKKVELDLSKISTVIVGRNNSGKTSLTELFKILSKEKNPKFKLEDFSLNIHHIFWDTFKHLMSNPDDELPNNFPKIKIQLILTYEGVTDDFGLLSNFIIDLDSSCTTTKINVNYSAKNKMVKRFFEKLNPDITEYEFYRKLKKDIENLYEVKIFAEDPTDDQNIAELHWNDFIKTISFDYINAQRPLDDNPRNEKAVLSKIFESILKNTEDIGLNKTDKEISEQISSALSEIEGSLDKEFNNHLDKMLPAIQLLGYPGLTDPELKTETKFEVTKILSDHTSIRYKGLNGVTLPESYNGLGSRNLIYIILKLYESFKSYSLEIPIPKSQIIFIEEPEAHLHPQMQTVFIRKLSEIKHYFEKNYFDNKTWPVQFIVTTHSSHIANEASFSDVKYFLSKNCNDYPEVCTTYIKDIDKGFLNSEEKEFVNKYMTLTRCDLFFADYAILIEGAGERILLPKIIEKFDQENESQPLGNKYLTILEVGGAYAHKFINLLNFLELRSLIITDLDSIDSDGEKCKVSDGHYSSNACINNWFKVKEEEKEKRTIDELLIMKDDSKVNKNIKLAYQIPENKDEVCGRSFEDAFKYANLSLFSLEEKNNDDKEKEWNKLSNSKKTGFAIKYAIEITNWRIPLYIKQGLTWLISTKQNDSRLEENL